MAIIEGCLGEIIDDQEVIPIGCVVKIQPNLIPGMEKQLLCATFLEAVIRFYEDPENMRSFERWRAEKGGNAHDTQRS